MRLRAALWVLAVALSVAAALAVEQGLNNVSGIEAAVMGIFAFAGAAAGLITWERRASTRMGPLLTLFAFVVGISALQQSTYAAVFTLGFAFGPLPGVILAHIVLAYPTGRLSSELDRRVLTVGYVLAPVVTLTNLIVYDPRLQATGLNGCRPRLQSCPRSVIGFAASATAFRVVEFVTAALLVLTSLVLFGLFVRRYVRSTPRARRELALITVGSVPLFCCGVALGLAYLARSTVHRPLFFSYTISGTVLYGLVVAGLLRSRIGHGNVGRLLIGLERSPTASLHEALVHALKDDSLVVLFWLPDRRLYVDEHGRPALLPEASVDRAVTLVEAGDEPLAALVHDAALLDDSELLDSVVVAARFALENARLQAELTAQLVDVRESRLRIVTAGDEERRRVERNIHDGAQQRLVSLALSLRLAERTIGHVDPAVAAVFADVVEGLQLAVSELRELASGLHPAILAEDGLAPALESLADRTPVPVTLDVAAVGERLPPEIELSAYFVASEAVANAVKHAAASWIELSAHRSNGKISIKVEDDGLGGADASGSGLRGLADRVAAQGGRLQVESAAGLGTRIVAELPCEL
jgi:signal transduction histidine kinase